MPMEAVGGTAAVTARRQRSGWWRHRAVGGQGAPVVADQDGVVTAAEDLVQRVGVPHQRPHLVAAVGGN